MAREASGLGLSDLKSVEFSLILTDGPASTNEWKMRGYSAKCPTSVPQCSHLMSSNFQPEILSRSYLAEQWPNSLYLRNGTN